MALLLLWYATGDNIEDLGGMLAEDSYNWNIGSEQCSCCYGGLLLGWRYNGGERHNATSDDGSKCGDYFTLTDIFANRGYQNNYIYLLCTVYD